MVDHRGILDFYDVYKVMLSQDSRPEIRMETSERVVPIIEGILGDSGYEEDAVNVPNDGLIEDLPSWIVVEVPAIINKHGVNGSRCRMCRKGTLRCSDPIPELRPDCGRA